MGNLKNDYAKHRRCWDPFYRIHVVIYPQNTSPSSAWLEKYRSQLTGKLGSTKQPGLEFKLAWSDAEVWVRTFDKGGHSPAMQMHLRLKVDERLLSSKVT